MFKIFIIWVALSTGGPTEYLSKSYESFDTKEACEAHVQSPKGREEIANIATAFATEHELGVGGVECRKID